MKKKIKINKKLALIILSLILSIISLVTFIAYSQAKQKIVFSLTTVDGKTAINSIKIGETQYKIKSFAEKYHLNYSKNNSEEYDWDDILFIEKNERIEFEVTKFHNINIGIDKEKTNSKVKVQYGKKYTDYDLTKEDKDGGIYISNYFSKIIIDYFNNISINRVMILLLIYVVSFFIIYLILNYILSIIEKCKKKNEIKIVEIIGLFLGFLTISALTLYPCMEVIGKYIIIPISIVFFCLIYYLKNSLKNNLHNVFILFAVAFTVLFSLILPPFHVPDEAAHYFKAYSVFNSSDVNHEKMTLKLKSNITNTLEKYTFDLLNSNYKTSAKEYFANFWVRQEGNKYVSYGFSNTYKLNSFTYIPSAIIIKITTLLNFPFIFTAISGRLVNALIFIILGFLALKKIPYFKRILFIVMLFPITIQQVSAVNQDSLTLSISFFLISQILYLMKGNILKIGMKDKVLTLILCCFIGICKPVYFPITFLLLLIPKDRFKSKKERILFILISILVPMILCSTNYGQYVTGAIDKQNRLYKMSMIFSQPFMIIKVVLKTILLRLDLDIIRGQINGFGWSTVWYGDLIAFVLSILYTLMLFFDSNEEKKLSLFEKIFIVFVSILIFGIVYASLLFSWTEYGKSTIEGLQSRYFIPIVLMLSIALSNNKVKTTFKNKELFALIVILITIFYSLFTIIGGFYI